MLPNNFSREYSRQGHQPRCVYAKITPEAAFYDAGRPLTGPGSPALHALLSVLAGTVQLESGCPLVLTAALASRGPWRDQLYRKRPRKPRRIFGGDEWAFLIGG